MKRKSKEVGYKKREDMAGERREKKREREVYMRGERVYEKRGKKRKEERRE